MVSSRSYAHIGPKSQPQEEIQIVFASWKIFKENETLRKLVTSQYHYPATLWEPMCHLSNGYASCASRNYNGAQVHTSWFHFLIKQLDEPITIVDPAKYLWREIKYTWYEMSFYVYSRQGPKPLTVLFCIDTPQHFAPQLIKALESSIPDVTPTPEPLTLLQSAVVKISTELYDFSVWTIRNHIRAIEKRADGAAQANFSFRELHDLARHIIHKCEVLKVAADTVQELIEGSRPSATGKACVCHPADATFWTDCPHNQMRFWQRMLKNFVGRADSLNLRLHNEINLGFHNVVQRDSRASIETSIQTMEISQAAKSDSASMKSISFVTLAFLPATFVSTLFGMAFFDFSPDSEDERTWAMSPKFWIYWVIAGPLTLITLCVWAYIQRTDITRWFKVKRSLRADKRAEKAARKAKVLAEAKARLGIPNGGVV
ncbi:hypothetical protein PV10_08273 [Exophiala mesophila]|uniref:Mg2+ transporter protein, CorA-like/Zinc transport protein ZntB n=1 Tax=Exophiala mesophila TaxID=212818 RepID=A0A0D1XK95_EXOME|nr:uncharacterized protein PV10_08273 [Exophiala mesophila]KIV88606.1 hypothetical protein PV10_08273 [Exophiala mesophila]